jgi:RNA polymerase sigma factor (TIGR02999 family)
MDARKDANTDALFAELYAELRQLARGRLRHERPNHTLSATSLTHEAYERLAAQRLDQWQGRGHFLAMAATMMRRILVDHALARAADKRSAELVTLSAADWVADDAAAAPLELLDLHRALEDFAQLDERAARVVELRYFGGLEVDEIAEVLTCSPATVKRDWVVARAWLKSRLGSA